MIYTFGLSVKPHFCVCLAFRSSVCEFETGGPEGIVESLQILKEGKASASEAVDCKWYIRAPPRSKVSLKGESPTWQSTWEVPAARGQRVPLRVPSPPSFSFDSEMELVFASPVTALPYVVRSGC